MFFDCNIPEVHPHNFTMIAIRTGAGGVPPVMVECKYGKQVVDDWILYREATLNIHQIGAIVRAISK